MSYQQDPYVPQNVYAQQQQLAQGNPSAQPGAYLPPQQSYPQPGAYYPPPQQPYAQPGVYMPPQQFYAQPGQKIKNPWASRALYSGVISLVLGLITFFSLVGFAGVITGTFAIVRGVTALNQSKNLPGNAGRGQAIAAIIMGVLAWVLVLLSFALRGVNGPSTGF